MTACSRPIAAAALAGRDRRPGSAPLPWQCSQVSTASKLSSTVAPAAACGEVDLGGDGEVGALAGPARARRRSRPGRRRRTPRRGRRRGCPPRSPWTSAARPGSSSPCARGRPGLLPEPRPAARAATRGRSTPCATSPRPTPRARAARPPRSMSSPPRRTRSSSSAPARRAVPRRARAHRAGRPVHLRDDHRPAEPLAPGAGLRADQARGHPGPAHGPGHVQAALPARLRELGDGRSCPSTSSIGSGSPPRRAPPGKDPPGFTIRDAAFNRRPVGTARSASPSGTGSSRPAHPERGLLGRARRTSASTSCGSSPTLLTTELAFYAGTADGYVAQPHQVARLQSDPRFHTVAPLAPRVHLHRLQHAAPRSSRTSACAPRSAWRSTSTRSSATSSTGRASGRRVRSRSQTRLLRSGPDAPPYDPAGAARLLEEAGLAAERPGDPGEGRQPLAFTLITNSGNEERQAIMVIAQNAWRRLGVKVETLDARVGRLHQPARQQGRLRRRRARLGHGSQRRHLPALPLEPDRSLHSSISSAIRTRGRTRSWSASARNTRTPARRRWPGSSIARSRQDQPYTFLYVRRRLSLLDGKIVRMVRGPDGTARAIVPFEPNRLGRSRSTSTSG